VKAARQEIAALQTLRATLTSSGERYWADRTQEQILAASAWAAFAERAPDKAVALMREAADGEDGSLKHVAMENRLYPMRELLGDLLLETGDARAALVEYRQALRQTPNRFRGLYGAARAADAAGDRETAVQHYRNLLDLAKAGDAERPELKRAREYLAARR
jgi:tetratricopeptide (TPR) repeat protein